MKVTRTRAIKWVIGFLGLLAVSAAYTAISWAGPPQGVTPTLIGRATYGRFKVKTSPHELDTRHDITTVLFAASIARLDKMSH